MEHDFMEVFADVIYYLVKTIVTVSGGEAILRAFIIELLARIFFLLKEQGMIIGCGHLQEKKICVC